MNASKSILKNNYWLTHKGERFCVFLRNILYPKIKAMSEKNTISLWKVVFGTFWYWYQWIDEKLKNEEICTICIHTVFMFRCLCTIKCPACWSLAKRRCGEICLNIIVVWQSSNITLSPVCFSCVVEAPSLAWRRPWFPTCRSARRPPALPPPEPPTCDLLSYYLFLDL